MTLEMQPHKFGTFLTRNLRPYTLRDDQDADLVGMRWYGDGPFHRELKQAHKIQKKSHFVIEDGDVIFNKLFAWKGAFGIVPAELSGMYVSDKFPTYKLDTHLVYPKYLYWYFRHYDLWEQARRKSTGSAAISKLTLNPPQFLDLEIPLPPTLDEQKRIAGVLDSMSSKLKEIELLRQASTKRVGALLESVVNAVMGDLEANGQLANILVKPPRNGWSPTCDNLDDGTCVLTLSAVTGWRYNHEMFKRTALPTSEGAHYWLDAGDLLITRSNTPELVGHAAIYNGSPSPCIYPDLMMKLTIDEAKATTAFVWRWLQSRIVREYVAKKAKGSSPTMKKISQSVVNAIPFPMGVSVDQQTHIVQTIHEGENRVIDLIALQSQASGNLDSIIPSTLQNAFYGAL